MHRRLDSLKRLVSLYGGLEEMHSIELQRTTAAVREVDHAIDRQHEAVRSSEREGRHALMLGDCMDWKAATLQRELAESRQERLRQVRLEREMVNDEARKQYIASRLQSEQMKHVVDDATTQAEIEAGRRRQATIDDRFLARRRWTDTRDRLRATTEISDS